MNIKILHILFVLLFGFCIAEAQSIRWSQLQQKDILTENNYKIIDNSKANFFQTNFDLLSQTLATTSSARTDFKNIILPLVSGDLDTFLMAETPVFEDELLLRYPDLHSYTGVSKKGNRVKVSLSSSGLHAMIFSPVNDVTYIDPINNYSKNQYISYHRAGIKNDRIDFECILKNELNEELHPDLNHPSTRNHILGDCQLRVYRLALACTGEYAAFYGGTIANVLKEYNVAITRINGIYERDLGISLKLISNTDKLIYLNASSDPYSNNNLTSMISENQTNIDNVIGVSNYDIGHLFCTFNGGLAQLRGPCGSNKARGATGLSQPSGDKFYVDFVAHEMGHQFGANHTQNNDCERNLNTSIEPGSGSTIMGYAGICDPSIANNSDPYFHGINILEIKSYTIAGVGNICPEKITLENTTPSIISTSNNLTIPISTSFFLEAQRDDAESDVLTYTWEQIDSGVAPMPPQSNNTIGPSFRSLLPTASPIRYFPDLLNRYSKWEVLPSVSRKLSFKCTVRDNNPTGGCTDYVDVSINTSSLAGPFTVTFPNNNTVSWPVGSGQTVFWDVANTDKSPINCALVNIFLSIDGGVSYPILLAKAVPNSGSYTIETPNSPTNVARIMVVADDNIFFDVSNANFKITSSFTVLTNETNFNLCNENSKSTSIVIASDQAINRLVSLSIENLPNGVEFTLSKNPATIPDFVTINFTNLENLTDGQTNIKLIATQGLEKHFINYTFFKSPPLSEDINLISPTNYHQNLNAVSIKFEWELKNNIEKYALDVSANPSFTTLLKSDTIVSNATQIALLENSIYYWRVRGINNCSFTEYSPIFSFKTGPDTSESIVLKNNVLLVLRDSAAIIDQSKIDIISADNTNTYLILTSLPLYGKLLLSNQTLFIGAKISLSQLIAGAFIYMHDGGADEMDSFTFDVVDDKNRWLPNNSLTININQGNLNAIATLDLSIKCNGDKNGQISVLGYNGQQPYNYSMNGITFIPEPIFQNLGAGVYSFWVKDASGNVVKSNEIIIRELENIVLVSSVQFYDVTINATGGMGDFLYSINNQNFAESNLFSSLENGTYILSAMDELGCVETIETTLDQVSLAIGIEIDNEEINCANDGIDIQVFPSGGFPPYQYSNDGVNFFDSNILNVRDASISISIFVMDTGKKVVRLDTILSNFPNVITADIYTNGNVVQVFGSGGNGDLVYSIDGSNYSSNNVFEFLRNGIYEVFIKDGNGCIKPILIEINVFNSLEVTFENLSCFESMDGKISILPQSGFPPYKYSLTNFPLDSLNYWTDLDSGIYEYLVIDANGDTLSGSVILTQPSPVEVVMGIVSNNLTIQASGGTPPYMFSIDSGFVYFPTNVFEDLPAHQYDIVVKDFNNCIVYEQATITNTTDFSLVDNILSMPNPFDENIDIIFKSGYLENSTISMTDLLGHPIDINKIDKPTNASFHITTKNLLPGVYFLRISYKEFYTVKKMIKI